MIEVSWVNSNDPKCDMLRLTNLLAWLTSELNLEKQKKSLFLQGYLVLIDKARVSALLFCGESYENQENVLKLIRENAPDEYKNLFDAHIMLEEPSPVSDIDKSKESAHFITHETPPITIEEYDDETVEETDDEKEDEVMKEEEQPALLIN